MKNNWDQLNPGHIIPELVKYPDCRQIFMFSAVTWNRHLIHYNIPQAENEGFPNVVVQRAMLGSYLAQFLTDWIGEQGFLRKIEWKVRKSAFAGDKLTCKGEVENKCILNKEKTLKCSIRILNQKNEVVADGNGLIIFNY